MLCCDSSFKLIYLHFSFSFLYPHNITATGANGQPRAASSRAQRRAYAAHAPTAVQSLLHPRHCRPSHSRVPLTALTRTRIGVSGRVSAAIGPGQGTWCRARRRMEARVVCLTRCKRTASAARRTAPGLTSEFVM